MASLKPGLASQVLWAPSLSVLVVWWPGVLINPRLLIVKLAAKSCWRFAAIPWMDESCAEETLVSDDSPVKNQQTMVSHGFFAAGFPPSTVRSGRTGCGSKPMIPFWGNFRTYFSGDWDVHYGQLTILFSVALRASLGRRCGVPYAWTGIDVGGPSRTQLWWCRQVLYCPSN